MLTNKDLRNKLENHEKQTEIYTAIENSVTEDFSSLKLDFENLVLKLNALKDKLESSLLSTEKLSLQNKDLELSMSKMISGNEFMRNHQYKPTNEKMDLDQDIFIRILINKEFIKNLAMCILKNVVIIVTRLVIFHIIVPIGKPKYQR